MKWLSVLILFFVLFSSLSYAKEELCNFIDDDGDGEIDEGLGRGESCTAGLGECETEGIIICSENEIDAICNAEPGTPTAEVCDNKDNDCDGIVDEGVCIVCGNGVLDAGEECDDGNTMAGDGCTPDCVIEPGYPGADSDDDGFPDTEDDCPFEAGTDGGCPVELCANGVLDAGEGCDGSDFGFETCRTQGFDGGTLSCNPDCTIDISTCTTAG
ncbi:hypothetical protein KY358_06340, partial [Candidatus Woesearchaeota archaeon]|nr:hypothetical protein [Candidatus Woesearchaeota archaeon]